MSAYYFVLRNGEVKTHDDFEKAADGTLWEKLGNPALSSNGL